MSTSRYTFLLSSTHFWGSKDWAKAAPCYAAHIRKIDVNVQIDKENILVEKLRSHRVCVCVYSVERFIEERHFSHLKFTFQHIELLQQTDGTFEYHTAFRSTFEHFRFTNGRGGERYLFCFHVVNERSTKILHIFHFCPF